MDVITIETNAFREIEINLKQIREELGKTKLQNIEDTWLSSNQVQKVLGISQKTWQTYRDKQLIKFSQIGQKIYVKVSWLEDFLEKHAVDCKLNNNTIKTKGCK